MSSRYLKIILVIFVGLTGLLFVAGNIANWNAGLELVGFVLSMEGHEIYGSHIFPPVTNSALVTIAFLLILAGEFLVGVLSLKVFLVQARLLVYLEWIRPGQGRLEEKAGAATRT